MSVLDLTSLLQLSAPELLAPPSPPVNPPVDNSTASTADSTSSGSSNSAGLGLSLASHQPAGAAAGAAAKSASAANAAAKSAATGVNQFSADAQAAAAALVDLGGASSITVANYQASVPPNLAAASALLAQLTASAGANSGVLSAAYVALSSADTLALTSGA